MIHIVTDTTAGLPQRVIDEYNVPVVPQYVHFGEETFKDMYEISPSEFYAKQAAASELPKTSAPSPADFFPIFDGILADDPEATILCIHPSPELSGTIRSAVPAIAEYPDHDIRIFDTRSVSIGLGMIVIEALAMNRAGAGIDDITATLETMRDGMHIFFIVDTLEYLAKGGRIGKASQLMGTLLDIKPILTLTDGAVGPHSKARTRKRAVSQMRDYVVESIGPDAAGLRLGIAHAQCADEAQALLDDLCDALHADQCLFAELGPAIGTHAGPGTLAVGWTIVSG